MTHGQRGFASSRRATKAIFAKLITEGMEHVAAARVSEWDFLTVVHTARSERISCLNENCCNGQKPHTNCGGYYMIFYLVADEQITVMRLIEDRIDIDAEFPQ